MIARITTPTDVVLEEDVRHVTAEDPTGSLGIRPGHAPLVTSLIPGIIVVRTTAGQEKYVAVNGGVLLVADETVDIVTRTAVLDTDLARLESSVVSEFEKEADAGRANHVAFERMRLSFMKEMLEFDRAEQTA